VLQEVMNNLSILAKNRGIDLQLLVEPGLPSAYGDPIRLKQIAYNLVNNAIKFTEEGSVSLYATLKHTDQIEIRIVDTGIGMTEEDIAGLFQQFHQVDGSPTRRAGGTGLGLVITKHLVEMHEGQILVESEKGKGSVFSFNLPVFAMQQMEMV
jgi:signal transduction histidine kinase